MIGLTATIGSSEQELLAEETIRGEGPIGLKDMVKIPAGPFRYGEQKEQETIEQAFLLDVYPVTNSQFQRFIEAGGYDKEHYWSEDGLKWKQKETMRAPRYWEDEKWNQSDHPVVGVSWYEAEAFATWAGRRLPTEKEWERVARGTDGRQYL